MDSTGLRMSVFILRFYKLFHLWFLSGLINYSKFYCFISMSLWVFFFLVFLLVFIWSLITFHLDKIQRTISIFLYLWILVLYPNMCSTLEQALWAAIDNVCVQSPVDGCFECLLYSVT